MSLSTAPSAIKLHRQSQQLEITFKDKFELSSEFLRVFSPSAEVRGHGIGNAVLQLNKKNVRITHIEAQGNYAIRIVFDDGHDSGIYSWSYLEELCTTQSSKWEEYQSQIKQYALANTTVK